MATANILLLVDGERQFDRIVLDFNSNDYPVPEISKVRRLSDTRSLLINDVYVVLTTYGCAVALVRLQNIFYLFRTAPWPKQAIKTVALLRLTADFFSRTFWNI